MTWETIMGSLTGTYETTKEKLEVRFRSGDMEAGVYSGSVDEIHKIKLRCTTWCYWHYST